MSYPTFDIIVACCNKNGIGSNGNLPWKLKTEMQHFKEITTEAPLSFRNVVIMGRKTWESIPEKYKPLPHRYNIILTSNSNYLINTNYKTENVRTYISLNDALEVLSRTKELYNHNKIFIIGGERLYKEAINNRYCNNIYMTKIYEKIDCDRFFPKINEVKIVDECLVYDKDDNSFVLEDVSDMNEENGIYFRYLRYRNINRLISSKTQPNEIQIYMENAQIHKSFWGWNNKEEEQYLNLLRNILANGDKRQTRNAVTFSKFGLRMEFDISTYLPVLTTKRVYWKGVVEELLWFLRGSTNAKELDAKGVKIWNGNTTREFLDSRGLHHYEEGDIGPTYGFGFRHYGAEYNGMNADYNGKGFDQIKYVLDELKNNPTSRRILINLWNPFVMHQMSLTPCACQYQFYVNEGKLSCQMYQRSADMFLGNPFNITSSSLLTYILAKYSGLKPHKLIICLGDAHIYEGHLDAVNEQFNRKSRPFPILKIGDEHGDIPENIEELEYKHFKLIGYTPHPSIKADMVA